jgi:hypothetical protein
VNKNMANDDGGDGVNVAGGGGGGGMMMAVMA